MLDTECTDVRSIIYVEKIMSNIMFCVYVTMNNAYMTLMVTSKNWTKGQSKACSTLLRNLDSVVFMEKLVQLFHFLLTREM